jgi:hypothetical protein
MEHFDQLALHRMVATFVQRSSLADDPPIPLLKRLHLQLDALPHSW